MNRTIVGYTGRGFPIWARLKDRYDADVEVISSSQAEEDCVWVFVKGGATDGNDGAILLTPEQASLLRDGLDAWLESVKP